MKLRNLRQEKAITLIALITTIIVIIILSSVSVNVLLGKNGLIEYAKQAVMMQKKAKYIELINIEILSEQLEAFPNKSADATKNGKTVVEGERYATNKESYIFIVSLKNRIEELDFVKKVYICKDLDEITNNFEEGNSLIVEIKEGYDLNILEIDNINFIAKVQEESFGPAAKMCKITYDLNGGQGEIDEDAKLEIRKGFTFVLPTGANISKQNYSFIGWNTSADGNGIGVSAGARTQEAIQEDTTYYAQWSQNIYVITYDGNGATSGSMTNTNIEVGDTGNLAEKQYERTGYEFNGWNTQANGNGTQYTNGAEITPEADMTLYAQWLNKYTVTFNANGGNLTGLLNKEVISTKTYGELSTASRTGYTFTGWYTDEKNGIEVTHNTIVGITQNQTLYAHWTPINYTVTVTAGTGIASVIGSGTYIYGQEVTIGYTLSSNYRFSSYTSNPNITITNNKFIMPSNNVNIIVNGELDGYIVTFNKNDGSENPETKTQFFEIGVAKKLSKNTFSNNSQMFVKWTTNSNGSGTEYNDEEQIAVSNNITLYAQWQEVITKTTSTSYVTYYADFDGVDGVDGIIYADLIAESGNTGTGFSQNYTIPTTVTSSNVKNYVIDGSYTDSHFGTHPIIKPASGTKGSDRFYVMELTDSGRGAWTGSTGIDFETGKTNCGVSENGKWFRPSNAEWAKFINLFGISSKNYSSTYGLAKDYWSSSQYNSDLGFRLYFNDNFVGSAFTGNTKSNYSYIRLSATF